MSDDNDGTFLAQHMCRPCGPSEKERRLDEIARRYREQCEAYDRRVCTGPIRDGAITPAAPGEMVKINRHANRLRRAALMKTASLGFTIADFNDAMERIRAR